jgi:putative transposase
MLRGVVMLPKRPRLKTFDYTGLYRYFLTFCTRLRRPLFTDAQIVETVLAQILQSAKSCGFVIPAYVFMPDHAHLLVEGTVESADLQEFVKSAKQSSAYAYARSRNGRLWQPSYVDRILREGENTTGVIGYIMQPDSGRIGEEHRRVSLRWFRDSVEPEHH